MDIWVTGIVMAGLGYMAAHIRLANNYIKARAYLYKAAEVLDECVKLEARMSDRSKVNGSDRQTKLPSDQA
jgi:hypothetical protein